MVLYPKAPFINRIEMEKTTSSAIRSKTPYQFRTVTFGDGVQDVQPSTLPVRSDLPFIIMNSEGPGHGHDADTKSLIRRTVMHDFVSKERKQMAGVIVKERPGQLRKGRAKQYKTNPQNALNQDSSIKGKSFQGHTLTETVSPPMFSDKDPEDGHGEVQEYVDRSLSSLLGPLGAGRVDPFDTYPVQNTLLNNQLLDHFVSVVAPALIPLPFSNLQNPLKAIWARNALPDRLLFQGILVVASVHLEVVSSQKSGPAALYYEAEIARTVNSRLENTLTAIHDSTICSVACLAAAEAFRGNLQRLDIHMTALLKMVELRGGLLQLGMQGLLQMTLTWVDLTTAAMENSSPRLPHIKCTNSISREIFKAMTSTLHSTNKYEVSEVLFQTPKDFPEIFHNIQLLSLMLGAARETRGADFSSVFYFCNMRFYLEHRLLDLPVVERRDSQQFLRELTRLASLIYLHRVLREFQPMVGVLKALKRYLIAVFQEAEELGVLENTEDEFAETLLWILFCAGTLWLDEMDKDWFSRRIAIQVAYLNLRTWNDTEHVLMRFLWIKNMCKEKCEALWREVEMIGAAAQWIPVLGL